MDRATPIAPPPPWRQLVVRNLLVAVVFLLGARLSSGLATTPSDAIAFWPPAGIALGAMILWGPAVWPAVFAAHALNSGLFHYPDVVARDPVHGIALVALAATGATLQALAGLVLLRRWVTPESALDSGAEVLRFLLLAGPVACVIGATLSIGSMAALGVLPLAEAPVAWLTWLTGDVIGVIVIAPLAQVYRVEGSTPRGLLRLARVVAAVAGSTALTIGAFLIALRQTEAEHRRSLADKVTRLAAELQADIESARESTFWVEGLVLASEEVTAEEFRTFGKTLLRRNPGLGAVGLAQLRDPGWLQVQYVTPEDSPLLKQGASLAPLLPGNWRGRLAGPGMTAEFPLGGDSAPSHTLVLLPIAAREEGIAESELFALGLLDHALLLEAVLRQADARPVAAALLVPGRGSGELMVSAASAGFDKGLLSGSSRRRLPVESMAPIRLKGLELVLAVQSPAGPVGGGWFPWTVLAWGMTFTALLQAFLLVVTGQSGRVALLVEQRTAELQRAKNDLEGVVREKERAVAAATEALDAAQAAGAAKVRFLATVSHELRTPMNAIMGLSEDIRVTTRDAHAREAAATIYQSAYSLLGIINDILDFSRLEAGKMELRPEEFALEELFEQLRSMFASEAARKGLSLSFEVTPGIPTMIIADLSRLRQILVNLLGNAVKFTTVGGISVLAEAGGDTRGERLALRIRVMDTGPGIPPEKREALFRPFSQVDSSWTRRHGGSGLGLAICRQLANLMDGTIELEEGRAIGSCFLLSIPVRCDRTKSPPRSGTPSPVDISFADMRVLVVEDHQVNMTVALRMLERLGVGTVLQAENGEQAIAQWRQHRPEAILMDLQLPVMDGLAAAQTIRREEAGTGSHVRIIAFTANAMESDRQACLLAGMDDFLTKPFSSDDLARVLARNLRDHLRHQRRRGRPALTEP